MNRLILGDCLEVLKNIENESVDLIYVDPPFEANNNYEVIWDTENNFLGIKGEKVKIIEKLQDWLAPMIPEMKRILTEKGICCSKIPSSFEVFVQNQFSDFFRYTHGRLYWQDQQENDQKIGFIWYAQFPKKRSYHRHAFTNSKQGKNQLLKRLKQLLHKNPQNILLIQTQETAWIRMANQKQCAWQVLTENAEQAKKIGEELDKKRIVYEWVQNKTWDKNQIMAFLKEKKAFLHQNFHVTQIGLFGSFAKGTQRADSDVDLLVDFEENTPDLLFLQEDLRNYFMKTFDRSVDLVSLKTINQFLKNSVLKNVVFV